MDEELFCLECQEWTTGNICPECGNENMSYDNTEDNNG